MQKLGHKNIAYVAAGTSTSPSTEIFTKGYESAMAGSGRTHVFKRTSSNPWSADECRVFSAEIVKFLSNNREFTGLITQVDWIAYEIIAQLHDAGIKVPEDVSIIGCDDNGASSLNIIGLSSYRTNLEEVGSKSARMLLNMIKGEAVGESKVLVPAAGFFNRKTTKSLIKL
jgi:DNA-binding LacI/PurR family transcriptional regulator